MSHPEITSNMQMIEHVFAPLEGKRIVDIGCGRGALLRALGKRGAQAVGADPSDELLAQARERAPDAELVRAPGEALPLPDAAFDAAIIMNALHHIPQPAIRPALAEALRVIRADARLLVLEPLARGGYQEVFAPLDDETEIRAMALRELRAFVADGGARIALETEYDTAVRETGVEDLLRHAVAIDPSRRARAETLRPEIARQFARHAVPVEDGFTLDQPMIAFVLHAA